MTLEFSYFLLCTSGKLLFILWQFMCFSTHLSHKIKFIIIKCWENVMIEMRSCFRKFYQNFMQYHSPMKINSTPYLAPKTCVPFAPWLNHTTHWFGKFKIFVHSYGDEVSIRKMLLVKLAATELHGKSMGNHKDDSFSFEYRISHHILF